MVNVELACEEIGWGFFYTPGAKDIDLEGKLWTMQRVWLTSTHPTKSQKAKCAQPEYLAIGNVISGQYFM